MVNEQRPEEDHDEFSDIENEVVEEEAAIEIEKEVTEPLTGAEVKERLVGLSEEGREAAVTVVDEVKDVWIIPARNAVRSQFNKAKRFLSELGGE